MTTFEAGGPRAARDGVDLRLSSPPNERTWAELEPLWLALFDHHAAVERVGLPIIDRAESWPRRRAHYEQLLSAHDGFVLTLRRDGRPVGYAMGYLHEQLPEDTWPMGGLIGEVETLSLLPDERGGGLGTWLLDAAEAELGRRGATDIQLTVMHGNDQAIRFYERRGMRPTMLAMVRLGRPTHEVDA